MKKLFVLSAMLCAFSLAAFAQAKPADFSGEWTLDKAKSTLPDRMLNIESIMMTVSQTEKEIKIVTVSKRGAPPAGGPGGPGPRPGGGEGRGPGGPGGGPGMGGPGGPGSGTGGGRMGGAMGDQTLIYALDGKETSTEAPGPGGSGGTIKATAKSEGGKLNLTNTRTFTTQMGEMKVTTKETWELQADGSLKVKRDTESMQGTMTAEMVFTKKAK